MKQKFSNSQELHEFFLSELKTIVGVNAKVEVGYDLFNYDIYPVGYDKCLWQTTLRGLFTFFSKYQFFYYIDFGLGKLHAYAYENTQMTLRIL